MQYQESETEKASESNTEKARQISEAKYQLRYIKLP